MDAYKPKKFAELNHNSPNLDLEITREILNRAKDNSYMNFFEITDEIKNSGKLNKALRWVQKRLVHKL